jgi:hypothetical protein
MTVPTRPERRRESRAIVKELEQLQKHSPLWALMKDKSINEVDEANRVILVEGKHEDKDLQEKWNKATALFSRFYQLEQRLQYLKTGYKSEQNIPAI